MVKLYCHKHEPDNVESKSEFEIHIVIKDNTVVVESDSKVIVQKTKKWKISITVAMIMKKRNLTLKKRREKSQHSLRVAVVLSQRMDPNTNESFATKTQKWYRVKHWRRYEHNEENNITNG